MQFISKDILLDRKNLIYKIDQAFKKQDGIKDLFRNGYESAIKYVI